MVTNEQSRQSEQSFPRYMNQEPNSTTLQILLKRTSLLEYSMRVLVLTRLNMRRACYMDDFLERAKCENRMSQNVDTLSPVSRNF